MAKQLNVNLAFTADTSKARAQLQDLQTQLTKLSMGSGASKDLPITKEIQEARLAAAELKVHLEQAMNVKTGTLDFTKLNQSITQSGSSLSAYSQKLQSLGTSGQQAFSSLVKAIAKVKIIDFLINLSYDRELLPQKRYIKLSAKLDDIVKYISGLLKTYNKQQ